MVSLNCCFSLFVLNVTASDLAGAIFMPSRAQLFSISFRSFGAVSLSGRLFIRTMSYA